MIGLERGFPQGIGRGRRGPWRIRIHGRSSREPRRQPQLVRVHQASDPPQGHRGVGHTGHLHKWWAGHPSQLAYPTVGRRCCRGVTTSSCLTLPTPSGSRAQMSYEPSCGRQSGKSPVPAAYDGTLEARAPTIRLRVQRPKRADRAGPALPHNAAVAEHEPRCRNRRQRITQCPAVSYLSVGYGSSACRSYYSPFSAGRSAAKRSQHRH